MKKVRILLILCLLAPALACCRMDSAQIAAPADEVAQLAEDEIDDVPGEETSHIVFSEPMIEAITRGILGKPIGGITLDDVLGVTSFVALEGDWTQNGIADGIGSLEDLMWFKNLQKIGLRGYGIKSLSGIEGLTSLRTLMVERNDLSDIKPVRGLVNLVGFFCADNGIADISPIAELKGLERLGLERNRFTDISVLERLPNLSYVALRGNPISEDALKSFYTPGEDDYFIRTFRKRINPELPEFTFELVSFWEEKYLCYVVVKIIVKETESGIIIQEIPPHRSGFFGPYTSFYFDDQDFIIEDMNFDGYDDIRILAYVSATINVIYECWIWDVDIGQYVNDEALSGIGSFTVDHENEIIESFYVFSVDETISSTYRYIDGTLTLSSEFLVGYFDKYDMYQKYEITRELIGGEMVVTGKKPIGERIGIGG